MFDEGKGLLIFWMTKGEYTIKDINFPKKLEMVKDIIKNEKNVANFPNSDRDMWAMFLANPPELVGEKARTIYFVGCMASFSPAVQDIPAAFAQILQKAGVEFKILGSKEYCCGYPLIVGGMRDEAEGLIKYNTETIESLGVKRIIFSCPSCYRTFREEYSLHGVKLYHHTQYLEKLIKKGKIKLKRNSEKVTYHDPCDLGRHSGVYEPPRRVIKKIKGIQLKELQKNRELAMCCGGGGDLEILDPQLTEDISKALVEETHESGAETVITACQQCKRVIKTGVTKLGKDLKVKDIAELVLENMAE